MSVDPDVPWMTVRVVVLAEMLKSTILTDTVVVWVSVPEVAVTVTVKVEGIADVTVKMEDPDPPEDIVTLVGFSEVVKP
jgi:hypothetical protein